MVSSSPLAGIRVIESAGWNGVLAGRLLADAGADVVRLILPEGDPLSAEPPYFGTSGNSIQQAWYNAGKRILELDLREANGRGRFLELIAGADVLIEDWPIGAAEVSPAELTAANPALVHLSVTPMGVGGPLSGWRVNDLVANALSGSASVTGNADTPPLSGYGNQSHHTVGLYVAVCVLAALRAARKTGAYQHVDLSAHEALISCTEQVLMEWFFPDGVWNTAIAPRQGSLHWSNAYEVFEASDGHGVMVTAALRFADVLLPWLLEEGAAQDLGNPAKYPNVVAMVRDIPYVMDVLRDWTRTKPGEDLFFEAQRRHQPFGVVWSIQEALTKSPQIEAREYLQPLDVPGFGPVPFPGRFLRTSADEGRPRLATAAGSVPWLPRPRDGSRLHCDPARPLDGLRVMDFTHVLAGPFGTRVLGDLGAEVIKVGTASRGGGANTPDHPYYTMWNRNKKSVTINMATQEGREVARNLAARSDVIIDNFSAGVLRRWGLDREGLRTVNPGVSVVSMGGMGQDGPWKDFVTFAPTIHALTGLTYLTNPPGDHFMGYGFSLTDHLSGLAGAFAALQAVEHRDRTGEGLTIDLSQYELGLGLMGPALLDYLANSVDPEPVGNRHPFGAWAPHGIYPAAGDDRWIAIAIRGEAEWRRFIALEGLDPDLVSGERFRTHADRVRNEDALDEAVARWTSTRDRYAIAAMCQEAGICAGPVQNAEDLTTRDPQLKARAYFGTAVAENWGEYPIDRFPATFNGARPGVYEGVHMAGADTFDVMTGPLELSDDELAALLAGGALT
ncbi:CoA transferase [Candidatus Amarobacter glycogenicus]|uniref:CaiB/BaiF CoA-transferase family protein n=1 Tax=Candidatus Amarobacter glycogenicus TaxID=3140699 RepID=UPI002A0B5EF9|nr:CoA transferase [Dehalococcoidia bacterium]